MDVEHLKSKADNVTYDVADATARAAITELNSNIADLIRITTTVTSTTTKTTISAHTGNSFANLFNKLPSVDVPTGYKLLANVHIELSGQVGLTVAFDARSNQFITSNIGGYAFNGSNNGISSGASVAITITSVFILDI